MMNTGILIICIKEDDIIVLQNDKQVCITKEEALSLLEESKVIVTFDAVELTCFLNVDINEKYVDIQLLLKLYQTTYDIARIFTEEGKHYYKVHPGDYDKSNINLLEIQRLYEFLKPHVNTILFQKEMLCIRAIKEMETDGLTFDYENWHKSLSERWSEFDVLRNKIENVLGSNKIEILNSLRNNGIVVDDLSTDTLKHYQGNPMVRLLLDERKESNYFKMFDRNVRLSLVDDKLYPKWNSFAAISGRISCRGPNVQAFPQTARKFVLPDNKECCLIFADYKMIEFKIMAEFSRDPYLIRAFREARDLHYETSQVILGKSNISNAEREFGKKLNYALLYGASSHGVAKLLKHDGINFSQEEVCNMIKRFMQHYSGIRTYQNKASVLRNIITPWGRSIDCSNMTKTQKINIPIQSAAADGFKEAVLMLQRYKKSDTKIKMLLHDEILIQSPIKDIKKNEHLLEFCMMEGMKVSLREIPATVNINVANCWCKEERYEL